MCMCVVHYLILLYHSNFNDRCSVGKTAAGKNFMSTHKDWEEGVSKPLKEFLCLKYRKLDDFFNFVTISACLTL